MRLRSKESYIQARRQCELTFITLLDILNVLLRAWHGCSLASYDVIFGSSTSSDGYGVIMKRYKWPLISMAFSLFSIQLIGDNNDGSEID